MSIAAARLDSLHRVLNNFTRLANTPVAFAAVPMIPGTEIAPALWIAGAPARAVLQPRSGTVLSG